MLAADAVCVLCQGSTGESSPKQRRTAMIPMIFPDSLLLDTPLVPSLPLITAERPPPERAFDPSWIRTLDMMFLPMTNLAIRYALPLQIASLDADCTKRPQPAPSI